MQVVRKGTSSACVLLISRQPWEAGVFGGLPLHRPLLSLHFADYSNRQLLDVLGTDFGTARAQLPADAARRLPDDLLRTLHAAFLSSVILDSFGLLTRDVRELRPLAAALWLPYLEPLLAGRVPADAPIDTIVRRLFTHATDKHVPALLRSFRPGMLPALQLKPGGGGSAAGGSGSGGGWAAASPSTSSRPTAMAAVGGGGAAGVPSSAAAALQLTALNKLLVVAGEPLQLKGRMKGGKRGEAEGKGATWGQVDVKGYQSYDE